MARKTAEEWAILVARWRRSGIPASEFAAQVGVKLRTLQWWSSMLANKPSPEKAASPSIDDTPAFIPVQLEKPQVPRAPQPAPPGGPIEIVVDNHIALRVGAGFDEDTLKRVLALLQYRGGA